MAEINRLMKRVKKLNQGNRLLALVFVNDDKIKVNYFVDGAITVRGTEYCSDENALDELIFSLMQEYYIFKENCCIYQFEGDPDE